MAVCEACWNEAFMRSKISGGFQADLYRGRMGERDGTVGGPTPRPFGGLDRGPFLCRCATRRLGFFPSCRPTPPLIVPLTFAALGTVTSAAVGAVRPVDTFGPLVVLQAVAAPAST